MKITGRKQHAARVNRLAGPEMVRQVAAALLTAGDTIQVEAQVSITTGSVGGKHHVASLPGEPPNSNLGVLANSIETHAVEPLKVEVSANAPYAVALEFGTVRMAARPYMAPAAAKKRKGAVAIIQSAVKKIVAGGKVVP